MAELETETRERTRILWLNRAPANTLTGELLAALRESLEAAAADAAVRGVVLASRIPKYFSSGLEPAEVWRPDGGPQERAFRGLIECHRALANFPKPTFAAVEGSALLGGFILALGCDWRLGSETAKVSLSEVRLGLTPTRPLITLVTSLSTRPALTKDLVLGGRTLGAPEALEAGLLDRVVPAGGALEAALELSTRQSKLPPKAFALVKRTYREALCPDKLWTEALGEFRGLLDGPEAAEGLMAIAERRRPRWE